MTEESRRGRGRFVRSRPAGDLVGGVALRDTLIRAALRLSREDSTKQGPLRLLNQDLREAVRVEAAGFTVIFAVDASDSMASLERLSAAKGAALYLLSRAYLRRLKVGLLTFRGDSARVVLEPTSSISLARKALARIEVGDATPLAAGLVESHRLASQVLRRDGSGSVLIALLSDGEANVPLQRGRRTEEELFALLPRLGHPRISYLFLDSSPGTGNQLLQRLAKIAGARYLQLNPQHGTEVLSALDE